MSLIIPHKPKMRKVFLALPAYGGTVCTATMSSIVAEIVPLVASGEVEIKLFTEVGHADIYSLRAQIVSHFLKDPAYYDYDDLVMVDSDVAWPAGGMARLLSHDVDLVAAPYPKRDYPLTFMFRNDGSTTLDVDPRTGLVEVWGMPGGFMRMTRKMLSSMWKHYDAELGIYDHAVPGQHTVRMFDPYRWTDEAGKRRSLSEDYAFCQRARDIGFKCWMDVQIPMAHIGNHAFTGKLGEVQNKDKAA
jgi:hypothetical protein